VVWNKFGIELTVDLRRKETTTRRRSHLRKERLTIIDFGLDENWQVHTLKKLHAPILPMDLAGVFSEDQQCIYKPLYNNPLWIWAFEQREDCIREIGKWISAPPIKSKVMIDNTSRYDKISLENLYYGWHTRRIIDAFKRRWAGILCEDGSIEKSAFISSSQQLLYRMNSLLHEVEVSERWCKFRFLQSSSNVLYSHVSRPCFFTGSRVFRRFASPYFNEYISLDINCRNGPKTRQAE
jgi:hypothetical protein